MSDIIFRNAGIVGTTAAVGISGGIMALLGIKLRKLNPTYPGFSKMVANLASNVSVILLSLIRDYFLDPFGVSPALVMAGIPMTDILELSFAMSDRILKYRSKGGIFLAHQEGGDQTLRIVGKAYGPNRYWFLSFLDFLFLWGSATVLDFLSNLMFVSVTTPDPAFSEVGEIPPDQIEATPWQKFDEETLEAGKEDFHLTFPVVTRDRVYNNMYIETFNFTESIEAGMNAIEYTIFLRKYVAPYPLKYGVVEPEEGSDKIDTWYYNEDYEDTLINKLRKIDSMIDILGSFSLMMFRVVTVLSGNSPERNIGYMAAIELTEELTGDTTSEALIRTAVQDLPTDVSLSGLSVANKEELMQVA